MIFAALALGSASLLSGCASILSKSQYPVTINSTPPGATVVVRNAAGLEMHKAQTPVTVTLPASAGYFSKARYSLEFSKEGHKNSASPLIGMVDPWYFGNILIGGLIGFAIIDPITGAMWELEPAVVGNLEAEPVAAPASAPAPATAPDAGIDTSVADQLKQLKELLDAGILSSSEYELKRAPLLERL